jgi:transcriptional regulator with XRE-family HTH domain
MYTNQQKRTDKLTQELRQQAGAWLRKLREAAGLSQRELAAAVGAEYYTFISQLETGRGRVPPDKYRLWAKALGVSDYDFVKELMQYYDPVTYRILFGHETRRTPGEGRAALSARRKPGARTRAVSR